MLYNMSNRDSSGVLVLECNQESHSQIRSMEVVACPVSAFDDTSFFLVQAKKFECFEICNASIYLYT